MHLVKNNILYKSGGIPTKIHLHCSHLRNLRFICYNNTLYYFSTSEYGTFTFNNLFSKVSDMPSDLNLMPYITTDNTISFLKPSDLDPSLENFVSFLPAVMYNKYMYFYVSVLVNTITVSLIIKTSLDLTEKTISKPFYIENKTFEHCVSFMINNDGIVALFYLINNFFKVVQLRDKIDDLL